MVLRSPYRERVEQLCEALESGHYSQANGALRVVMSTGDGYCCLGVACDVMDQGRWGQIRLVKSSATYWIYLNPDIAAQEVGVPDDQIMDDNYLTSYGVLSYMPADVFRWYGFPDNNPSVDVPCLCTIDPVDKELGYTDPRPDCHLCSGTGEAHVILTELNDEWHVSFKTIAAAIRRTFLGEDDDTDTGETKTTS